MDNLGNTLQNNALEAMSARAPRGVMSAIQKASAKTGVDFAYMVQQAAAESSFNPSVKAKSSSATGLYQFIDSTWMSMIEQHGEKYGVDTEGKSRRELLDLRKDAEISSYMAAEFASDNERFLNKHWGGDVGATELYFAHFLGAGQAASFLQARDENPLQEAGLLFPKAAAANRNVFYDTKTGRPKTLDEVYAFFDKKFDIKDSGPAALPDIQVAERKAEPVKNAYRPAAIKSSVFTAARETNEYGSLFQRSYAPAPYQALIGNPIDIMMLAQLDLPLNSYEHPNENEADNKVRQFLNP